MSTFRPAQFLTNEISRDTEAADLVILNQPIASFEVFARLWRHARYRICADGGANRLFDLFRGPLETRRHDYLPNIIHGDLDSLRMDVRYYYEAQGVEVSQDHDQYSTDFGKAMQKIVSERAQQTQHNVLVLGTIAGRVDQGIGLLHEMIREETRHKQIKLWLVSECSITFVLGPGNNTLEGLTVNNMFTPNVGLLPLFGPSTISTSGLEYDVAEWRTEMGGQVSTSNHITTDQIHVCTTEPILFTVELADPYTHE